MTYFKEPIFRILRECGRLPGFQWPTGAAEKLGTADGREPNQRVYCSFHNEQGHYTTACQPYKVYLEELVQQGRMDRWIDRNKSPDAGIQPRARVLDGVVQCIHGPMDPRRADQLHKELCHPSHEVVMVQHSLKRKMEARHAWEITFTEQDLEGLSLPHNDALVLSIPFQRKMVHRVLVDQGSSAEILYYSAFQALGLSKDCLLPVDAPLVGFSGIPIYPLGKIVLPVYAGSVQLDVEFIVVNSPSPYNAILGRNWLHGMRAVASTLHQCVRFIGESGRQETIRGDQMVSKKCFVNSIRRSKEVQWIEVSELPEGSKPEEVGRPASDRAVEDLVQVPINEDGTCFFLVGSELDETERDKLIQFLKENIEVFAWTPYEMPGMSPDVIKHSLNVDPGRKPVIQKPRRSSAMHTDAVNEEVERLLDAGAIREVQYPT
ncbi:hypothetical protein RHGRI_029373 [Rhododendron griersonianum]|uniref:Uncharacterized protein n=1 Tax=Rhododendron griersonianum TaxID=479676 RepID=A0AAV6IPK8_9ERIC|nr:hypothetical protein RHGRI_029373 [Rhododendron griersonianum]